MFLAAGETLAATVSDADLARGRLVSPLSHIRGVSAKIAREVATIAYDSDLAGKERPDDILEDIQAYMFQPVYPHHA